MSPANLHSAVALVQATLAQAAIAALGSGLEQDDAAQAAAARYPPRSSASPQGSLLAWGNSIACTR